MWVERLPVTVLLDRVRTRPVVVLPGAPAADEARRAPGSLREPKPRVDTLPSARRAG
jgi:hypothetical protein